MALRAGAQPGIQSSVIAPAYFLSSPASWDSQADCLGSFPSQMFSSFGLYDIKDRKYIAFRSSQKRINLVSGIPSREPVCLYQQPAAGVLHSSDCSTCLHVLQARGPLLKSLWGRLVRESGASHCRAREPSPLNRHPNTLRRSRGRPDSRFCAHTFGGTLLTSPTRRVP